MKTLVDMQLIHKIDPDAPAASYEDGQEVAAEVTRTNPELSRYMISENRDALESYLAGKPMTVNSFRQALVDLSRVGKLLTLDDIENAEKKATAIIAQAETKAKKAAVVREENGRFAVTPEFREEVAGMTSTELKQKYERDLTFRKRYERLIGFEPVRPKQVVHDPVSFTPEEIERMSSTAYKHQMQNPNFAALVEKYASEGRLRKVGW